MADDLLKLMKDEDVQYVDLRFTDPRGKMQHVSFHKDMIDDDFFTEGQMFDGSSVAGWKAINESDMVLMPDTSTAIIDPFFQQTTLAVMCDILDPISGQAYNRDPRTTAKKAEAYVKSSGVGDTVFFGPEAEFFVFDDVRWSTEPHKTGYSFDSTELPVNTGKEYPMGNMGHRPGPKGGYFPVPPVDSEQDMRSEMLSVMGDIGLNPEKHHHEVAPAQHELGMKFATLTTMADRLQLYKYVIHNVAASYGKTATFMPKPMFADNGSGMHVHQSIWAGGKPLFAGDQYAGLSEQCLYYIGGIIKHARALNALTNPSTNSYKRLVRRGLMSYYSWAPVFNSYGRNNRTNSVRVPMGGGRCESRNADASCNPYLAATLALAAGLEGIREGLDPGPAQEENLYEWAHGQLHARGVRELPRTLDEAVKAFAADPFVAEVLGEELRDEFVAYKSEEWRQYHQRVSAWEIETYARLY